MKHLTYNERKIIEEMLLWQQSHRSIGKRLGRDHTVISNEIKKNGLLYPYSADRAQLRYERFLRGKKRKKIDEHLELRKYVIEKIQEDWSPQQVEGRLKKYEYRTMKETISHETIYQFVFSKEGRALGLPQHLRTGRGRRRTWTHRMNHTKIPQRISIHERPEAINEQKEMWHWESDLMIFSQQKPCVSVEVERVSKICSITKLNNKTDEEKLRALHKTKEDYAVKSITFDNGTENAKHTELHIPTYFCDPYKSYQKGLVENTNKLLRQYLPRWTHLSTLTEQDMKNIQDKLNNRPRKSLKFLSPNEFLLCGAFNT